MEKQQNQAPEQQPQKGKKKPKKRKRSTGEKILFFSVKWTFVLFCLFLSVIAGLVFGYSIIGDGKANEVFDLRMWKHLYDLVYST